MHAITRLSKYNEMRGCVCIMRYGNEGLMIYANLGVCDGSERHRPLGDD